MPTNPILDELGGLSPGAQQALIGAHSATTLAPQPPPIDPGLQAPSKIQKPAQIGAPPPAPTATMSGPPPSMGAPSMPNVEAPRGTLQGDQNERGRLEATGPGITQIHSKIENSQFGQNHPTLGKIAGYGAEIPLRVLEAAGSMLGPVRSAEQLLPGTQAHHAMEMRNLNATIGNESKENLQGAQTQEASARTAETGARTGLTEEQLKELPGRTASEEALQSAEAYKALHPQDAWEQATGVKGPNGEVMEHNRATGTYRIAPGAEGASLVSTDKLDPLKEQAKQEYMKLHPGATLDQFLHDYAVNTQPPQRAPIVNMVLPGQNGGPETLQAMRSGQEIPKGAQTVAGMNAVNTPTTTMRTAAGRAATVVAMAPEVLSEIDRMGPSMGPILGRWNDFYQGKVGMDNPEFSGLRTDLVMMSTAVALAHAQGRLPEGLRLEFDHMINAPHQTPENIKATINHVLPWLQKMQEQGGGGNQGGGNQPPPASQGNWNPKSGRYE